MQSLKSALNGLLLRAQLRCDDMRDWFRETEPSPADAESAGHPGGLTAVMPLEQRRVLSVAPVVMAPLPVNEGDAAELTFDFSDTDSTGAFTIEVDWDGSGGDDFETVTGMLVQDGTDYTFTTSLQSPLTTDDNATFPIRIRVTDSDGDATILDTEFTVRNVAPTIDTVSIPAADEGGTAPQLTISFSDPGVDDRFTIEVDWDGDGMDFESVGTLNANGTTTHSFTTDLESPLTTLDNATFPILVRISDGDDAVTEGGEFVVNNVAPTIEAGTIELSPITQGNPATLTFQFTDPGLDDFDPANATTEGPVFGVDWDGDGTFEDVTADGTLTLVSEGRYEFTVTSSSPFNVVSSLNVGIRVTDNSGDASDVATGQLVVTSLLDNVSAPDIAEGDHAALSFDVAVPDGETVSVLVDWADSNGFVDVTPTGTQSGTLAVSLTSPDFYRDDGLRTLRIRVTSSDGAVTYVTQDVSLTVLNVAPTIDDTTISLPPITQGNTATLTFEFTDPGLDDTFMVFADWGGTEFVLVTGTVTPSPTTAGRYTFTGESSVIFDSKTPRGNPLDVQFYVKDNGGGQSATETAQLVVNDLLDVDDPQPIDEGSSANLMFQVKTPGNDPVTVFVDWGDGNFVDVTSQGTEQNTLTFDLTSPLYPDQGVFTLRVQVRDAADVVFSTQTVELTVNNLPPTIGTISLPPITQGTAATLTFQFTDPGVNDFDPANATANGPVFKVDWGDGDFEDVTDSGMLTANADGSYTFTVTSSNVFDVAGTRTVRIQVSDNSGAASEIATQDLVVNSLLNNVSAPAILEGQNAALSFEVTRPDSQDVLVFVDWGDDLGYVEVSPDSDVGNTLGFTLTSPSPYRDDGPRTLQIRITNADESFTFVTQEFSLTVNNVAPTIDAVTIDPESLTQGNTTTLTIQFSDPGLDDFDPANATTNGPTFEVDWDGDGDFDNVTALGTLTPGTDGHHQFTVTSGPFDVAGSFNVRVRISDNSGDLSNVATARVDVGSLLNNLSAPSIFEGQNALLTFDVTAPDVQPISVLVDWADGENFVSVTPIPMQGVTTSYSLTSPNPYADNTTETLRVRVINSVTEAEIATGEITLEIRNVAPTIIGVRPVSEGDTELTVDFTDPGLDDFNSGSLHRLEIDWGDGFTDVTNSSTLVEDGADRTFTTALTDTLRALAMDDATFPILIRVTDKDGGVGDFSAIVTVNNVAPTIALSGAADVDEGSEYTLTLGAVTDPGDDTVTAYIVDWGDGSGLETFTTAGDTTHTYTDGPADVTITVALTDEDGTHAAAGSLDVTVDNVAPTIAISGAASADEGSAYTLTLGAVTDPGDDTVTAYIVNWGDGSGPETFTTAGAKTHTYTDGPADVSITVDLTDEDSLYTDAGTLAVMVNNVAPTIDVKSITASDIDRTSRTTTLTVIFSDPGLRDFVDGDAESMVDFRVDWGDSGDGQLQNSSFEDLGGGTWRLTADYQYNIRQATNQAVEFTITASILDKDAAESNVVTTIASAPQGIQLPRLITNAAPPALNLQLQPVSTPVFDTPVSLPPLVEQPDLSSSQAVVQSSETRVEIRVVLPDGSELVISLDRDDDAESSDEEWSIAELDDILERLLGMPSNRYRVYQIQPDGVERIVVDVVIREGRVQDAEDLVDPLDAVRRRMEQSFSEQTDAGQPEAPTSAGTAADPEQSDAPTGSELLEAETGGM